MDISLYVVRRLAQAVPLIFVVILLNFFLIHAAPGDPIDFLVGSMDASPEYIEDLRREFGLDQPLGTQLWAYLTRMAHFDLGYSLRYRQSVLDLILSRMPATLLLMVTALVASSAVGILLGVIAAQRPYSATDQTSTFLALAGYSMPVFWLGQLVLIVFSLHLGWFPTQGMYSLRAPAEGWGRIVDVLHHLALPAFTYSLYHLALIFRLTRIKMQETLSLDFIVTARAKGASEGRVVYGHALRNAILPVVTVIGMNFGFMLAGSVLTETVFAWPGMGRLLYEAIQARDYPVLMGLFTVLSLMVIAANVVTDLIYAVIDPRVVYR
ncbi:ABC transporter permease [Aquabacter spiritensis]|uniref:ABC transporter permease n=1 Tax=Aquabacter spiritensis TaxID=933073 RepID=UPI001404FD39|nr:ABC transporter permease [Aquabacter spiritensis]